MAEQVKIQGATIPLRFRIAGRMPAVLGQEVLIHTSSDGVLLTFYEVIPPVVLSDASEDQVNAIIEAGILAECVSRILIPNSKFKAFADAISQVSEDLESKNEEENEEGG